MWIRLLFCFVSLLHDLYFPAVFPLQKKNKTNQTQSFPPASKTDITPKSESWLSQLQIQAEKVKILGTCSSKSLAAMRDGVRPKARWRAILFQCADWEPCQPRGKYFNLHVK